MEENDSATPWPKLSSRRNSRMNPSTELAGDVTGARASGWLAFNFTAASPAAFGETGVAD
ncbi:hypothetical protein GCM10022236_50280 [Microlunatus ginsengisoli]|uniref:Uncharacterized protein n=1 Tax=Microlunatus ginsengisoli TaxID=363863 RepID=A0ABP7AVG8_9ACTN